MAIPQIDVQAPPLGNAGSALGRQPFPQRGAAAVRRAGATAEKLGLLPAMLIWLFFEYGRPPRPMGIPMLMALIMAAGWLFTAKKQINRQTTGWIVLLGVMAIGIPLSDNSFAAFWTTREMVVLFLCICIPLQSLITSVRRARIWILTFIVVATYVGAWAATHGGYGPSGASGGQDENYVAALMCMALPFSYFSIFIEKRFILKLFFALSIIIFVAAIALGNNPSRGGFLGLISVAVYCLWRSPKKVMGLTVFAVVGVAFMLIAGDAFWAEIGTTTDYSQGTGNDRLEIWAAGVRMWASNPLFGVGPGNFRWVIGDYQTAAQYAKFGRSLAGSIIAHSSHVEMIAELGTLGALTTLYMVLLTWLGLGKVQKAVAVKPGQVRDLDAARLGAYSEAFQASILAILVNGIFLSLFYYSHLWLLIAAGSALPFIVKARMPGAFPEKPSKPTRARVRGRPMGHSGNRAPSLPGPALQPRIRP